MAMGPSLKLTGREPQAGAETVTSPVARARPNESITQGGKLPPGAISLNSQAG